MDRPASHSASLRIYFALNAAALLAAGMIMLALAGGGTISTLRSVPIAVTFLLGVGAVTAAILLQSQPAKERALHDRLFTSGRTPSLKLALGLLFTILWCLTWLPPQHTAEAHDYFIGLYPLILCGLLASGSALVIVLEPGAARSGSAARTWLREQRTAFNVALIVLAAFAAIILLTARLQILAANEPLWYGAGVPLLASQVFIVALAALALQILRSTKNRGRVPPDLVLFLIIWAITAVFWAARPVPESYWVTGPRAPNWEFYPFSDLVTFDLGSQFALIGQGIFNGVFFDRALYVSFLVYLHSVGGQNYQQLMAIQAAIFAVFPAVLYLIGKKLHSRMAGLILAALTALRGLNSLTAAAWIDTATFKHMLTDFPTAIGVAIFVLLMLGWLEDLRARWQYAVWGAGVLGLTSLLRPHVLLLVPPLALLAVVAYRPDRRTGLWLGGLTLMAFVAGIAPWMFLGPSSGSILGFYGRRFNAVIVQRYPRILQPPPNQPTPVPGAHEPPLGDGLPDTTPPQVSAAASAPRSALPFIVPQFVHNVVTAGLIFPDSPLFLSVRETVKSGEEFWRPRWDGSMSPAAAGMLIFNLSLVAIGMGVTYERTRWRGLLPVAVMLIYDVANAFARSSGGRYLVPTDWILVGYYAIGVATLIHVLIMIIRRGEAPPATAAAGGGRRRPTSWWRAPVIVGELALVGALIPLAGVLYPRRYPQKEPAALLTEIAPYLAPLDQSESEVAAFLQQPGAFIEHGRALYPRFYPQDVGEPTRDAPFGARNYPRVVFVLIGPHGYRHALLPGRGIHVLPNASDAIVLGCRSIQQGFDVVSALLVVLPDRAISYVRQPAAPLACPLPEPVCDTNKNCH